MSSFRVAMLNRLIVAPVRTARTGAIYVRQRLSIQELFRRGNALLHLIVTPHKTAKRIDADTAMRMLKWR